MNYKWLLLLFFIVPIVHATQIEVLHYQLDESYYINQTQTILDEYNLTGIHKVQIYKGWAVKKLNVCGWYTWGGYIIIDSTCDFNYTLRHEILHHYFWSNPTICNYNIDCEHDKIESTLL